MLFIKMFDSTLVNAWRIQQIAKISRYLSHMWHHHVCLLSHGTYVPMWQSKLGEFLTRVYSENQVDRIVNDSSVTRQEGDVRNARVR